MGTGIDFLSHPRSAAADGHFNGDRMKYVVALAALFFSLVSVGAAISALNTGRSYWKTRFVERASNPATYWLSIVTYGIMAVVSLLMALGVLLFR